MHVILIPKSKTSSRAINLGPLGLYFLALVILLTSAVMFYAGKTHSMAQTRSSIKTLYSQAAPDWNREMNAQKAMLEEAQQNAEKNLDALASRLSQMQAHILRLDALGSRLADMADIKDIDFDMGSAPGIGGPKPQSVQGSIKVNDFIAALERLDVQINDRSEKLAAIESMLIDRSLQDKTTPVGKPIKEGWVSSLFGKRTDPITGKVEFHEGIDYAGKSGSPIIAVASGIVTWSGLRYGYGNMVEINHGNGYQTRYAHNKKNLVTVGQKVEKGQIIALMGSSGRATGPHVHFEVVTNGKAVNPRKLRSIN